MPTLIPSLNGRQLTVDVALNSPTLLLHQIPEFELEPGAQPTVDDNNNLTTLPLRWAAS